VSIPENLPKAMSDNLHRKAKIINVDHLFCGVPAPRWIDVNITELCNRSCEFCPRVDENLYPNQPLHMSISLAKRIHQQLSEFNFSGVLVLSGYSEPLLHPDLCDLVRTLKPNGSRYRLEIVTNGDKLKDNLLQDLYMAGCDYFVVSLYDGPEQISHYENLFLSAKVPVSAYVLRDRWYDADTQYGLKLTNRAGNINKGELSGGPAPCYYLAYSMMIDWNGDVLLCVQDWDKRVKYGNLHLQSIWSIWNSSGMMKRRHRLLRGDRGATPCNKCDASGVVHGAVQAAIWSSDSGNS
jgi:radical SAM protein with 4Fe4S-binding SPASM domain